MVKSRMITVQELADLLGLNRKTIIYRAEKLGIELRSPEKWMTKEEARKIGEFKDGRRSE